MLSALPPQALLMLFLWPRLFLSCLTIWLASSNPPGLSLHTTSLRGQPCPTLQMTDSPVILSSSPLLFLHSTYHHLYTYLVFVSLPHPCGSAGKESACNVGDLVLGWEDPLEKGKATHSSILAWRIPWTVQSIGSQRVG